MKHETDLSAEQTQETKKIWIPSAHEDSGGAKSPQPPPQSRPENAISIAQSFPKTLRFRNRGEFQRISRTGRRAVGQYICVDCRKGYSLKLGITASTKYGSSPERNRFKRLVREAFRLSLPSFPPNLEIHVVPRQKAKSAQRQDIQNELLKLLC